MNFAISADGKISSTGKRPSGWTSPADHTRLLALRSTADAILVGKGTLVADRMTMTVPGKTVQPLRCIVTRGGSLDPDLPVFQKPGGAIHLCVTGDRAGEIPGATAHHTTLPAFLGTLATDLGVKHLHCEGGGELVRALAELDAIDEFHLTLAGHTLFGGLSAPTVTGIPSEFLPRSLDFEINHFEPRDGECFLSYRRKPSEG
ncbi:RibD family protein [Luteolibacter yonseiensis]|uniref:RibD family protein n=1 Tax=Luteolibacter yonseiensis TaxID=1144680 RepID=A0A934VC85_9BACT|nr:RibD family protein [Luteolibacter yonseiensis]MBK1816905.1 RibD family protein [Luteolibacter yonseiensis]